MVNFSINGKIFTPLVQKSSLDGQLSIQTKAQSGQSVDFSWSGGTSSVCPPLPVSVRHEAKTLQPNTNLQFILF